MKKTLKQLQKELDDMQVDRDKFYSKWSELKEEKDRKQHNEMLVLHSERDELVSQVRNLLEVIRWHINPNTTESPFLPTKNQRDERPKNY